MSGRVRPALALRTQCCSEALQAIVGEMVQMHGGLVITREHDAHPYLRNAFASTQLFGAPSTHLNRLAAKLLP
ncbi:acyl-CoA dehydrogenase family protein [Micromonospora sp. L32]|uniref:acyl-CoA dehydrogenase family protein n=1 Tax=unclassified Micromonospora TaxID=2617518 RepID=UPI003F8BA2A3